MKTIALVNYKGGVGKTTLTANLAAGLALKGKKVLAVDLDPQANLTFSFFSVDYWARYLKENRTIKRWYDEFIINHSDPSLRDFIVEPEHPVVSTEGYLHLIPSHINMFEIDVEMGGALSGATERQSEANYVRVLSRLRQGLTEIGDGYDVVLLDCPPSFNTVTQSGVAACDYYIIPSKPDYLSTLGLDTLYGHVNRLRERYNRCAENTGSASRINPCLSGVIFTMVAYNSGEPVKAQTSFIDKVRKEYPVYRAMLRENKTLFADAPQYGVPVVLRKAYGDTYRQIQEELTQMVNELCDRCQI